MMSESAFFEARGSVVLQFVIVISLAQAEEETWLSVKPEERPLVNLVTPRFSPAARVLNELGELVRGPPEEAFPLLDSVLARHLTSSSSSSSSSSILSQCLKTTSSKVVQLQIYGSVCVGLLRFSAFHDFCMCLCLEFCDCDRDCDTTICSFRFVLQSALVA